MILTLEVILVSAFFPLGNIGHLRKADRTRRDGGSMARALKAFQRLN